MAELNQKYPYEPDYAIAPGETLIETIESLGMSQKDLAKRTGRPLKTINEIIKGKTAITPETALQFERVLGVPAEFWNNLEKNYRQDLARIKEKENLNRHLAWLEKIPVRSLIKAGWIQQSKDKVQLLQEVLTFFGIASTENWDSYWKTQQVAFRKSPAFKSDLATVASWLRIGEVAAQKIECELFDQKTFKANLQKIRSLTQEPVDAFIPALTTFCAQAGVAVVFVPELPKLRISGVARWLNSAKAIIQLSLRYKTNDHLWFTFFHEAGHLLLHGKKEVFLDDEKITGAKEDEANRFASDLLIPPADLKRFVLQSRITESQVKQFANDIGIADGIVVGRLQHDKVIPFFSQLNSLKARFEWKSRPYS